MSASTCVNSCPSGKFGDYATRRCLDCHSNCVQCKGASEFSCLACSSDKYLKFSNIGSECLAECPSGYYGELNYMNPYTQ